MSPDLAPCSGKPSHLIPPAPWRQQSDISNRMSFLLLGLNWLAFVLFLNFFKHPPAIPNYIIFEMIFLHIYRHTHLFLFNASGIMLCILYSNLLLVLQSCSDVMAACFL